MLRLVVFSLFAAALCAGFAPGAVAQVSSAASGRYALILKDPPLARQVLTGAATRRALAAADALERGRALLRAQEALKEALSARKIAVTGAMHTLLNAVFVSAAPDQVAELRALAGVAEVVPLAALRPKLNKALGLIGASAGWSALGGASNAGAGMKIGILDTGIDQAHPGFADPSLAMPAGYPVADNPADLAYATNKIIAVRSYVAAIAVPSDISEFTTPDDLSPLDHVGHGTAAAMIAAGVSLTTPLGVISGVAPQAWLGNYKIFGSPGVNDTTSSDVVLQALEDAFGDGMNVALVSAGDMSAVWGPADQGATCGLAAGELCDPWAAAVSAAGLGGMVVVLPAGNDGALGNDTINTPGDVDGVITVGATTNAHIVAATVSTPAGTTAIEARLGNGPQLTGAFSAVLFPVSALDATQHACLSLPAASLSGKIALLTTGQCSYFTKVANAEAAGAVAVLMFSQPGDPQLFSPQGLENTGIPMAQISNASGVALKAYLASNPGGMVTFDPATLEVIPPASGAVAYFSSRGPNIGDLSIKPDLAAPGASIYTAAQNLDPNGALYSPNRYIGVDGTSFAAAFATGAAALVAQSHPAFNPGQIKSALVNTASGGVTDTGAGGNTIAARSIAVGGGLLNVSGALASTLTIVPATVGFGNVASALASATVVITNTGPSSANIILTVQPRDADSNAHVTATPATFALAAGQSQTVAVSLNGSIPEPGLYEGVIAVAGGAVALHIPFLYMVGSGIPSQQIPLLGDDFVTEVGTAVDLAFRTVDSSGVPVTSMPVRFAPASAIYAATPATDPLGIAEAYLFSQDQTGDQSFSADLLNNSGTVEFPGRTRALPQISANGIADAASYSVPVGGFAPGSYISIFGSGLSESYLAVFTPYLPLSLAGVSVSFDVPAANIHVPAHFYFVNATQIDVQIPWELAGQPTAEVKVTLSDSVSKTVRPGDAELGTFQSQLVTIPIGTYAPEFFLYVDQSGTTLAAALDQNNVVIGTANPVQQGGVAQLFLNGLGPVASGTQPASGQPSPGTPSLATTPTTPVVTIGGQPATVLFSGLAPLAVGLYQVNVEVPTGIVSGNEPVVLTIGSVISNTAILPVQ
jgi:minor extracellular serine protease Vpr